MPDINPKVAQILSEYNPSWRERIGNATYDIARALSFPYANRLRDDVEATIDFVPALGDTVGLNEAYRDYDAGNYLSAAGGLGLTAIGAVPGVGDVAAKALRSLPSSASLNIPIAPTVDLLKQYGRMEEVPLSMARGSQPRMEWDKFNSGQYGVPMFEGFDSAPVAVMRRDGEYILYDGHHRTVQAMNEGRQTLPMHVIDAEIYDPANAGKIPSLPSQRNIGMTDDELLRELGF